MRVRSRGHADVGAFWEHRVEMCGKDEVGPGRDIWPLAEHVAGVIDPNVPQTDL